MTDVSLCFDEEVRSMLRRAAPFMLRLEFDENGRNKAVFFFEDLATTEVEGGTTTFYMPLLGGFVADWETFSSHLTPVYGRLLSFGGSEDALTMVVYSDCLENGSGRALHEKHRDVTVDLDVACLCKYSEGLPALTEALQIQGTSVAAAAAASLGFKLVGFPLRLRDEIDKELKHSPQGQAFLRSASNLLVKTLDSESNGLLFKNKEKMSVLMIPARPGPFHRGPNNGDLHGKRVFLTVFEPLEFHENATSVKELGAFMSGSLKLFRSENWPGESFRFLGLSDKAEVDVGGVIRSKKFPRNDAKNIEWAAGMTVGWRDWLKAKESMQKFVESQF